MAYYLKLQFKRINRHLEALGFNVVLAYVLSLLAFVGMSKILFEKIKYAQYIYIAVTLWTCYTFSNPNRNQYLQLLFQHKNFRIIRLIENILIAIPFVTFLLYQNFYPGALIVLILAIVFSTIQIAVTNQFTLPTPFYKKPFEFITGFRKHYLIFIFAYLLTGISIYVDNFNLGIFALVIIMLTTLNFYAKPEPLFYIWTHAFSAANFLNDKIKTAISHSLILITPLVAVLLVFHLSYWYIIGLVVLLCMMFLILILLGKYANYPAEVNLMPAIAIALSLLVPPFLCVFIPYFYLKAKQNLSQTVL